MNIKDMIAQVRAKLSSEEVEKVNGLLSEIVRAEDDLLSDRSAANNESKSRKEKIRELESNIEEINGKLSEYESKVANFENEKQDLISYKEKWEAEQEQRNEQNKQKWNELSKRFEVEETDPKFEQMQKLKAYYKFGDELTADDIKHNISLAEQHNELGLFTIEQKTPPNTKKPAGDPPKNNVINPYK